MKLELLLSTMNLKNETESNKLIQKMNVNTNTLTINQITNKNIKETNNLTSKNKLISVRDKGLSKSRNMAINNSEADICIIADDDVIYKDNFQNIIKKELISIIMPVFNCAKYLEETITSVKKQTYTNWELIIIDDASTDNSLEEIKKNIVGYEKKIKTIHLPENKGAANARNIGLTHATGNYIAFLDADDIWIENKLEEQIKYMQKNDYGFTYTSYTYLKNSSKKCVRKIPPKLRYKDALKNTVILTSTVMIDIRIIDKKLLQMPDIKRGQDMATWWQILKQGNTAYGLDKRLTIYRRRKDSLSFRKNIALKRTWNLYRNVEKFSLLKSLYYYTCYMYNAIKRRIA